MSKPNYIPYEQCPFCGQYHQEVVMKKCSKCKRYYFANYHDRLEFCHKCRSKSLE